MLRSILSSFFGCSHQRTTFPQTPLRSNKASRHGTYVVCLDCGKEFAYDWTEMRVGEPVVSRAAAEPARAAASIH